MQSSKRLVTMIYQSYAMLPEIVKLENMRQEVANARESMQMELDRREKAKQIEEAQIEFQVSEPQIDVLLHQVVEDSLTKVGKSRIVRVMEELRHKIASLFIRKEDKNKKQNLERESNDEIN